MNYVIEVNWDCEAGVWYAVCDEIPIALESESFDTLIERVKVATQELLELNGKQISAQLHFKAARFEDIA